MAKYFRGGFRRRHPKLTRAAYALGGMQLGGMASMPAHLPLQHFGRKLIESGQEGRGLAMLGAGTAINLGAVIYGGRRGYKRAKRLYG